MFGHSCHGTAVLPQVFANGERDIYATHSHNTWLRSGHEIAKLIEDAIVGQVHLVVHGSNAPILQYGCRVINIGLPVDEADDDGHDEFDEATCGRYAR